MNQLSRSAKKWNEETDLERWETHYYEDNYNGHRLRSRETRVLQFLDSLRLPKNAKILELGYGAGMTSAKIYQRGFNLIGIDISNKLQKIATKNCQKVTPQNKATFKFQVGNAEQLDFPDNTFDCVIGLGFIHYLARPITCIKEAKRVLKPNGHFIITQRNMYGISSIDGPVKWVRSLYYLITNRRYELRWQDTHLIYPFLTFAYFIAPFSKRMRKMKFDLKQHQKIGLVPKTTISHNRLKKMIQQANLKIIKTGGAGYLTKKNKLFPKTAKRIDQKLQKISNKKRNTFLHKIGNSVVFLAKKEQ